MKYILTKVWQESDIMFLPQVLQGPRYQQRTGKSGCSRCYLHHSSSALGLCAPVGKNKNKNVPMLKTFQPIKLLLSAAYGSHSSNYERAGEHRTTIG